MMIFLLPNYKTRECFNGHDMIPNNWDVFISGFKNLINKYDQDNILKIIK